MTVLVELAMGFEEPGRHPGIAAGGAAVGEAFLLDGAGG